MSTTRRTNPESTKEAMEQAKEFVALLSQNPHLISAVRAILEVNNKQYTQTEEIVEDDAISIVYGEMRDKFTREVSSDLLLEIAERTLAEEKSSGVSLTQFDRLAWMVKEAYCHGYANGYCTAESLY